MWDHIYPPVITVLKLHVFVADHLYPSLPATSMVDPNAPEAEEGELEPFSEAQLRTLYYNQELEENESFVDNFLQVTLCKKVTIHQVTTMLATSKNVLFQGHNHRD